MRQGGFQAVTLGLANAGATSDEQLKEKRWAAAHFFFLNHFFWIIFYCTWRRRNAKTGLQFDLFVFINVAH